MANFAGGAKTSRRISAQSLALKSTLSEAAQRFALLFLFNMNEGIVLNRTFVNVVVEHSRDEYVVLL